MKDDLIKLINQADEIQKKFHNSKEFGRKGRCLPDSDFIYDVPEFIEWKEAIKFELQDIFDRTNDKFVGDIIKDNGIINQFNGKNFTELNNFETLKYSLKNIKININKYYPIEKSLNNIIEQGVDKMKNTKVFISHSSKDVDFVAPLVELLADIGLTNDNLFCSSIPDYGIPLGENIYDYLSNQFNNYDLFVIFVLSSNYYKSAACLNEMGAAWVLKNDYVSVLVPGFNYQEIKGAVNPNNICIKLDENDEFLKKHLGDLKNNLSNKLSISVPDGRWENKRNDFINAIKSLKNSVMKE